MSLAIWGDLALASRPSKLVETFEELNVAPELTEALASEGIEQPTQLQETVIPILSKGNNNPQKIADKLSLVIINI